MEISPLAGGCAFDRGVSVVFMSSRVGRRHPIEGFTFKSKLENASSRGVTQFSYSCSYTANGPGPPFTSSPARLHPYLNSTSQI